MKIKLLGVLALVLLGSLVGCNTSIEDRHNLEENWRYDELTHWKCCDDADCLMKDPYPKYLEDEHDFVFVEKKISHGIGRYDYSLDVYKCSVCDYTKTDNDTQIIENGIYGSFDNPAAVEDMPRHYMKNNITFNSLSKTDFPREETTYYAYYDLAESQYLFIKVALAHKQSDRHDTVLEVRGSFSVYDSNKQLVDIPRPYSFVTGETNDAFDRTLYGFYLYAIEVPAGRYYIGVTHEQWSGTYCYVLEVGNTPFVDSEGIPY